MPPNPPNKAYGDMQISKSEKEILPPPLPLSNPGYAPIGVARVTGAPPLEKKILKNDNEKCGKNV